MKKNLIFAAIFGLVFGLPLTALLVSIEFFQSYWSFPYAVFAVMAVLFLYRYMLVLGRRAGNAASTSLARAVGRFGGDEAITAVEAGIAEDQKAEAEENYLQMLLSLGNLGALLATCIAAFAPLGTFMLLLHLFGDYLEGRDWATGLVFIVSGGAGILWLRLLDRFFNVRIVLPIIPLNVVWFAYGIIALGVLTLIVSVFR